MNLIVTTGGYDHYDGMCIILYHSDTVSDIRNENTRSMKTDGVILWYMFTSNKCCDI